MGRFRHSSMFEQSVESGFESLMCEISSHFIDLPTSHIDAAIEVAQRLICEELGFDCSALWQTSPEDSDVVELTRFCWLDELDELAHVDRVADGQWHSDRWSALNDHAAPQIYQRINASSFFPWTFNRLRAGNTVVINKLHDLPPEADRDISSFRRFGTHSAILVPFRSGGKWFGCISFASTQCERNWSPETVERCELIGRIFMHALSRKPPNLALQENKRLGPTVLVADADGIKPIHSGNGHKAPDSPADRERLFRTIADSLPVLIWLSDVKNMCIFVNKPWLEFTGRSMDQETGAGWLLGVHPEDQPECREVCEVASTKRQSFVIQGRFRRRDGVYRWITSTGVPRYDADGQFCGFIGACVDVTERMEAEQAARDLSGRLINAQEEERARLARDLHDDVTQRLARLAIDVGRIERSTPMDSPAADLIQGVREGLVRLGDDVHDLSHQLHPSTVVDLGLVDALKSECEEFSNLKAMAARFLVRRGLPEAIPSDMAIGLFRIAQEALHNAVRHGRASKIEVSLWGVDEGVQLVVQDNGVGFVPNQRRNRPSLGIASMQERARLLGGTCSVESSPGNGTIVVAWVPLSERIL